MESSDSIGVLLSEQPVTHNNIHEDDYDDGSLQYFAFMGIMFAGELYDKLQVLAGHPFVEATRNNVSILLGEGGTIGFMHPMQAADKFIQKASSI